MLSGCIDTLPNGVLFSPTTSAENWLIEIELVKGFVKLKG